METQQRRGWCAVAESVYPAATVLTRGSVHHGTLAGAVSEQRTVIGVDVGGTKTAAALLRLALDGVRGRGVGSAPVVLARAAARTDVSSAAACLDGISACIEGLAAQVEVLDGIGLGIAAEMDYDCGTIVHSVHLPLDDVPVRALLARRHGVPVAVDNDATAAAIGEHAFGAGRGCRHMVMLTLGTGVGGGIICDGRPYRGASGAAGELGHMVVAMDGPACPGDCPNHGCLEAYVSGTALGAAALAAARDVPSSALSRALRAGQMVDSRLLVRLAQDGDDDALALLTRRGEILGVGLTSLTNIFNPEVIVVGGGVGAAGELLLAPARRVVLSRALVPARRVVRIVSAELGPDSGVYGAAALVAGELDEAPARRTEGTSTSS